MRGRHGRCPTLQRRIAMKFLTAIPVYNEERHVEGVLREVRRYSPDMVVIDDGSTDRTAELLARQAGLRVVTHDRNRGYGAAMNSAFDYARGQDIDYLVSLTDLGDT